MRVIMGALLLGGLLTTSACEKETERVWREPPPPAATATAGACDKPGRANNPKNLVRFPPKSGAYCLDPQGSDTSYGEEGDRELDEICSVFDGECEIYKGFGVVRVVEGRYIDGGGSGATIDVKLSRYGSPEKAYAMFTKRVVGDGGNPAHPDTPKPIEGGGAAALGIGNAYLWSASYLAEITYNDTSAASIDQVKTKADALLPPLVKAFGEKLGKDVELPAVAQALPSGERIDLGIRYVTDDVLGVQGAGGGAYGYYSSGDKRWRVLSVPASSDGDAKGFMGTLKKGGGLEVKGVGDDALKLMVEVGGVQTEWLVWRARAADASGWAPRAASCARAGHPTGTAWSL